MSGKGKASGDFVSFASVVALIPVRLLVFCEIHLDGDKLIWLPEHHVAQHLRKILRQQSLSDVHRLRN